MRGAKNQKFKVQKIKDSKLNLLEHIQFSYSYIVIAAQTPAITAYISRYDNGR